MEIVRLVWSAFAIADRDGTFTYIENESPRAAIAVDARIAMEARRLFGFPESGHLGWIAGTRELIIIRTPYVAA